MSIRPSLAPGRRVYAIGDVHGRLDVLRRMHEAIDRDIVTRPVSSSIEIMLGDLVDRGPASRDVIEALITRAERTEGRHQLLGVRGNHEDLMMGFVDAWVGFDTWRELGGYETILSYGVPRRPVATEADRVRLRDDFLAAVPEEHVRFIEALQPYWIEGGYVFVHAGLRPGIPLPAQAPDDLRWIREEFLDWQAPFEYHVVHGHTPVPKVDPRPNRTNIDTGVYATGMLSCLVLEDASRWLIEATIGGAGPPRALTLA
jgi:serine/threonine protein phosphatase 1